MIVVDNKSLLLKLFAVLNSCSLKVIICSMIISMINELDSI